MKIQLLYFPDCPNVDVARAALREVRRLEKRDLEIEEIDVSRADAPAAARGWGSPTVLIEGLDAAGEAMAGDDVCCRLYKNGAPSVAEIRERIAQVERRGDVRGAAPSRLPILGGVLAALAASACCVIPAVLAIIGVSGAGVAAWLGPWRAYFLAVAAVALAVAFWFAYRPLPSMDACGCTAPRRRRSKIGLWIGAAVILGVAGYPLAFDARTAVTVQGHGVAEITLHITGMDCRACVKPLAARLAQVTGVATVDVDYTRALATITHDGKRDISRELLATVDAAGYAATVVR